jgi:aspartate aminotransferase-like enzyme
MDNRIKRHKICAEAFYAGLNAMGLTSFANSDARSNVVISVNYLPGMDDKKFRALLSEQFKVLVAGGFGELKGKVFRIGSMGEVNKYHVMRTLSSIVSSINMLGLNANPEATSVALEKMKSLP